MAFDNNPLAITGAKVTAEMLRLGIHIAAGSSEGVVSPYSLKVYATGVPSSNVQIGQGAGVVTNRSAGGGEQAYGVRNTGGDGNGTVDVPATGSGGKRSDMLVVRVEDPQYSPWTTPANIDMAVLAKPFIVQGVAGDAFTALDLNLGYSAIALARIDIPANTATITPSMIVDTRQMIQSSVYQELFSGVPVEELLNANGAYHRFPRYTPTIRVPDWANWVSMQATAVSLGAASGFNGEFRARIGSLTGGSNAVQVPATPARHTVTTTVSGYLQNADRNRLVELVMETKKYSNSPGNFGTVPGSQAIYDVRFSQRLA